MYQIGNYKKFEYVLVHFQSNFFLFESFTALKLSGHELTDHYNKR